MNAHTGELLSGSLLHFLNLDSEGFVAEVGAASPWTTRWQCWRSYGLDGWNAGVLRHFGVDFSGRLFEVVGTTAKGSLSGCTRFAGLVNICGALSCHQFPDSLQRMRTFESAPEMELICWSASVGTCFCWSVVVGGCVLLGPHMMSAFAPISSHLGFRTW